MKIVLVDDEKPARNRLKRLLTQLPDCQLCAEAANGEQALLAIREQQPDIVLLDIRMPGMDGLELAQRLLSFTPPPAIIFTTAYDQHAIEAFDTNAVAYLLKPIRRERLVKALDSARTLNRAQLANLPLGAETASESIEAASTEPVAQRTQLQIKLGNRLELIALSDVYYFQADQKYVIVRHVNGEAVVDESLKTLENEFADMFLRIHRNALIAVAQLAGIEKIANGRYQVIFNGIDDRLEVSRRHVASVRRRLRQ